MQKVLGIGGFFWRSRDPKALGNWYEDHLGINPVPTSYDGVPWRQEAGVTVLAPFDHDTTMFAPDKQWMINFRVDDLDGLIAQLRAAGIAVETRPDEWDTPETGRFARIADPEGNQIELWQPPEG
jgi:catechol 2,3-dioxygenase-like lactoylglutathione lyase family enzyme